MRGTLWLIAMKCISLVSLFSVDQHRMCASIMRTCAHAQVDVLTESMIHHSVDMIVRIALVQQIFSVSMVLVSKMLDVMERWTVIMEKMSIGVIRL